MAESGKELVPASSNEVIDEIKRSMEEQIAKGVTEMEEEKKQELINQHYYDCANKILHEMWKLCEKKTGHRGTTDSASGRAVCKFCAVPMRWVPETNRNFFRKNKPAHYEVDTLLNRIETGIFNVAKQLRAADREAGIEWTP